MEATRLGWIGLGGLVLAAAAGAAWLWQPGVDAGLAPRAAPERAAMPAPLPVAARPATTPIAPLFHVARVSARGMLVTAGAAAPGAEVQLLEKGREIGRARADARGEWVILPAEPLVPGPRELSLLARSAGEPAVAALDTLLLMVPDPPTAEVTASRARADASGGMALLLPPISASGAAPRLLQAPAQEATARPRLGLDVVDYDDAGAMRFAGSAPPGAVVRVYVGRDHAGDARADGAGRWTLNPAPQPGYGRHTLRLDQIAAVGGVVAARVELPFQRDRLLPELLPDGRMVVQPGTNLWRIARETYGEGTRYTVIYQANRELIRDPNLIYPGQVFSLPGQPTEPASSLSR